MSNDKQTLPARPDGHKVGKWQEIRQDGKLLFEYDPIGNQIRLHRWQRDFVVNLDEVTQGIFPTMPVRDRQACSLLRTQETAVTPTLLK